MKAIFQKINLKIIEWLIDIDPLEESFLGKLLTRLCKNFYSQFDEWDKK